MLVTVSVAREEGEGLFLPVSSSVLSPCDPDGMKKILKEEPHHLFIPEDEKACANHRCMPAEDAAAAVVAEYPEVKADIVDLEPGQSCPVMDKLGAGRGDVAVYVDGKPRGV
ncbi:MAG: hypothetical protein ACP5RJ_08235, partial [Conexivisphaera sp.]